MKDFHNAYVEGLGNANTGFAQTTTLKLLTNLYDSYGTTTPREMEDATNTMVAPYEISNPITNMFIQIEKGVQIADASNTPFTNAHIIASTYVFYQKTGQYGGGSKYWFLQMYCTLSP